jgi:hypothetical protein
MDDREVPEPAPAAGTQAGEESLESLAALLEALLQEEPGAP